MSGAELSFEIGGALAPLVEPGDYEGVVKSWKLVRPFGRHGIDFEVELVGGSYTDPVNDYARSDRAYTPSDCSRRIDGLTLIAHFNLPRVIGGYRVGRKSKLARAFVAVFDGRPPGDFHPNLLVGRRVRCRVKTVTIDSDGNSLHRSCWYSKIATFLGPGLGDDGTPF